MRLLIHSDLHLDSSMFYPPANDTYDVVVLAGDVSNGIRAIEWARFAYGDRQVVFVPGNHESYGQSSRSEALEKMREQAAGTNVHLLDRDELTLDGVRFLGTTLWTDFALGVDGASRTYAMAQAASASNGMSDFLGQIREFQGGKRSKFTPRDSLIEHELDRAWLLERLAEKTSVPTVVVTHHAPSDRGMHPKYAGSVLNAAFYSNLPPEFFAGVSLWVHGHSHSSSDYMHHGARVLANPRGYRMWNGQMENVEFDPALIIEVASA